MRRLAVGIAIAGFVIFALGGTTRAAAPSCVDLIKQAKTQVAAVKEKAKRSQAQSLIQKAESAMKSKKEKACIDAAERALKVTGAKG